ncbi:MAG: hypothetical protein ACREBS_12050 [Nitrososphaerales archaeon]
MSIKGPGNYGGGAKAGAAAGVLTGIFFSVLFVRDIVPDATVVFVLTFGIAASALFFALVGVAYSLLYVWLYPKLPTNNPIIKAEIIVLGANAIIDAISEAILHMDTLFGVLEVFSTMVVLGFFIGLFYSRSNHSKIS